MSTTQEELLIILKNNPKELNSLLDTYHESDIADALPLLAPDERITFYHSIDSELLAEIFTYLDDATPYLEELSTINMTAEVINEMDADDVVDILENIEEEDKAAYIEMLDEETKDDVALINSYDDNEIASKMTTNFITISKRASIKEAMKKVISEAPENDNINIIYCLDDDDKYYGAIHLKDLIIARSDSHLDDIIKTNYPILNEHDLVDDVLAKIKDYYLEYLPILNDNDELIGIITHEDIIETVDEEMSEDYSKFAGLTSENAETESFGISIRKRIPWLCVLLVLDLFISSIISGFEDLIAVFPIIAAFQSLLLDMSGNSGTQALAVTILSLSDSELTRKRVWHIIGKEVRIGLVNGIICGTIAFVIVGLFILLVKGADSTTINGTYVHPFIISGIIGSTLMIGITVASFIGCAIPMFFKRMKIDPATASGPFITSINDIISILMYFGIVLFTFSIVLNVI